VLSRIFEPKRATVNMEWRILLLFLLIFIIICDWGKAVPWHVASNGSILPNRDGDDRCMWNIDGMAVGRGT
jgi:hypothetical protein